MVDGQLLEMTLIPDSIQVDPEPQLRIAYFLEKFIVGPDPFFNDTYLQQP